jgi:hypothetical protein
MIQVQGNRSRMGPRMIAISQSAGPALSLDEIWLDLSLVKRPKSGVAIQRSVSGPGCHLIQHRIRPQQEDRIRDQRHQAKIHPNECTGAGCRKHNQ